MQSESGCSQHLQPSGMCGQEGAQWLQITSGHMFSIFWGSGWDLGRETDGWMLRVQNPPHLKRYRLVLGSGQCQDLEHCQAGFSLLAIPISGPAISAYLLLFLEYYFYKPKGKPSCCQMGSALKPLSDHTVWCGLPAAIGTVVKVTSIACRI